MSAKKKFYIEIDCCGEEASGYEDRLPWVCYGTIVAEGDNLDELLENASVDLIDQDGGDHGPVEAGLQWMQDAVEEKFYETLRKREELSYGKDESKRSE